MKIFNEWISNISRKFKDKKSNEITLALILKLIFFNGLLKKEIFEMKIKDLQNNKGNITERVAKSIKYGIPIDNETIKLIEAYLLFLKKETDYPTNKDDYLFPLYSPDNNSKKAINSVDKKFSRDLKKCGICKIPEIKKMGVNHYLQSSKGKKDVLIAKVAKHFRLKKGSLKKTYFSNHVPESSVVVSKKSNNNDKAWQKDLEREEIKKEIKKIADKTQKKGKKIEKPLDEIDCVELINFSTTQKLLHTIKNCTLAMYKYNYENCESILIIIPITEGKIYKSESARIMIAVNILVVGFITLNYLVAKKIGDEQFLLAVKKIEKDCTEPNELNNSKSYIDLLKSAFCDSKSTDDKESDIDLLKGSKLPERKKFFW